MLQPLYFCLQILTKIIAMKKCILITLLFFGFSLAFSSDYKMTETILADFDNSELSSLTSTDNPNASGINTSAKVGKTTTHDTYPIYSSFVFTPSSNNYHTVKLKYYYTSAKKVTIQLAIAGVNNNIDAQYTTPGEWQELTFDLSTFTGKYNTIKIMPNADDWNNADKSVDMYIDDIVGIKVAHTILADFDTNPLTTISTSGGAVNTVNNPDSVGVITLGSGFMWSRIMLDANTYDTLSFSLYVDAGVGNAISLYLKDASGNTLTQLSNVDVTQKGKWLQVKQDISSNKGAYGMISLVFTGSGNIYMKDLELYNNDSQHTVADFKTKDWDVQSVSGVSYSKSLNPSSVNKSSLVGLFTLTSNAYDWFKFEKNNATHDFIQMKILPAKVGDGTSIGGVKAKLRTTASDAGEEFAAYFFRNGQWQTITFDVSAYGKETYSFISILPDVGNTTPSSFYFDDITFFGEEVTTPGHSLAPISISIDKFIFANFETKNPEHSKWNLSEGAIIVENPAKTNENLSDSVARIKLSATNAQCVTFKDAPFGQYSKMKIRFYCASDTIRNIAIKYEAGNIVTYLGSVPNGKWKEIEVDVSTWEETSSFSIFPSFYITANDGFEAYIDEITFYNSKSFELVGDNDVQLSTLFSDSMVVPQDRDINIFGEGTDDTKITVTTSWDSSNPQSGTITNGKWSIQVKTPIASFDHHSIKIEKGEAGSRQEVVTINDVLSGEVWLCSGQSNMQITMSQLNETPLDNPNIRLFNMNPILSETALSVVSGSWKECNVDYASNFSALGYLLATELSTYAESKNLDIPIGVINTAKGNSTIEAWVNPQVFEANADLKKHFITDRTNPAPEQVATHLYNGTINPIANYTTSGMIWYQGESNYLDVDGKYASLQTKMIDNLRNESFKNESLPFYLVQIAPYGISHSSQKVINRALFRDEQIANITSLNNVGFVSTIDLGDNDIHPAQKLPIAQRLARMIEAEVYGDASIINYKSPTFKSIDISGKNANITLDQVGSGLKIKEDSGDNLKHFWIAGSNKVFYEAKANLDGDIITVTSSEVSSPIAVRYAYYEVEAPNLFTNENLPVVSFRTDNWTDATYNLFSYGIISNFDDITNYPTGFWSNGYLDKVANPQKVAPNTSDNCAIFKTNSELWEGFKYTSDHNFSAEAFTFLKFKIYCENDIANITLKFEDTSGANEYVGQEISYETHGNWKEYTIAPALLNDFDITKYNQITFMPDLYGSSSFDIYFDDFTFGEKQVSELRNTDVSHFSVYPIPCDEVLYLNSTDMLNQTYKIVNTNGQTLKNGKLENSCIDVSQLNSGLYILVCNENTIRFIKK